jgi:hypothetical protein
MDRKRIKHHFANSFGKIFIDTAKVVLGSFVIGTILKGGINSDKLVIIGTSVFFVLSIFGVYLTMYKNE